MARRATPSTKKPTATQAAASADRPEQAPAKAPRRGSKTKPRDTPPAEMSVADSFFPGGEEPVASAVSNGSGEPAKARRMRKPRLVELAAETLTTDNDDAEEAAAPTEIQAAEEQAAQGTTSASGALPAPSLESADARAASQAARWDANTGAMSFDWPVIEAVAATAGPNQAMAKLLLAARAEGANSRWPF